MGFLRRWAGDCPQGQATTRAVEALRLDRHLPMVSPADNVHQIGWSFGARSTRRSAKNAKDARLGPAHPTIRTQYAPEEMEGVAGVFPPARQAPMRGEHPAHLAPEPGGRYALCVDVAGQSWEGAEGSHHGTACTLFSVELPGTDDPLAGRPRYRVVRRWRWRGLPQAELYARLVELAEVWSPRRVVVDATGLGEGLASFLAQRLGARVTPFVFTAASRSSAGPS